MFLHKKCISITAIFLSGSRLGRPQDGQLIGKYNVALGIRKCGALNEQYQNVFGWGATDPASLGYVGIRNKVSYTGGGGIFQAGTITGVDRYYENGRNEGWSAGTYDSSGNNYPQWCGDNGDWGRENLKQCKIKAKNQKTKAISTSLCKMPKQEQIFLKVKHTYAPVSGQQDLYRITVTIQNMSENTYNDVRYFRMFDWDIDPTPNDEYVTHRGTACSDVARSVNNGFCHPNPNSTCNPIDRTGKGAGDFTDFGSGLGLDHGSTFEFKIGSLGPKKKKKIKFYYGLSHPDGGGTTALTKILNALNSVGANVYSLGKSSINHPTGYPYTFAFGYKCSTPLPLEEDVVGPQVAGTGTGAVLQNDYSWINRNKNINCMTDPETLCTGGNKIEGLLKCPRSCARYCADDEKVCAGKINCDNYQLRFACWETCGLCYQDEGTCLSSN